MLQPLSSIWFYHEEFCLWPYGVYLLLSLMRCTRYFILAERWMLSTLSGRSFSSTWARPSFLSMRKTVGSWWKQDMLMASLERYKFICRVVGDAESVVNRMVLCWMPTERLIISVICKVRGCWEVVENLTVADVAHPFVTNRVMSVFQQQLIHVQNGCMSDDPEHLPYIQVGTVNFHNTRTSSTLLCITKGH